MQQEKVIDIRGRAHGAGDADLLAVVARTRGRRHATVRHGARAGKRPT